MLNNWLKIAFINYKKNWLSTIINLFGLTIGLTGFMLILMHWNDEESFEKWNPKKDNIFYFQTYNKKDNVYGAAISIPYAENALKRISEVQDYVLMMNDGSAYKMTTKIKTAYQQGGLSASDSFFNLFPFKLVAGSYKDVLKNDNNIAISTTTAKNLFGKTAVVGEIIKINTTNFIITAVYELPEGNSQVKPEFVFKPVDQIKNDKEQWGNFNYAGFFLLKKGADPRSFEKKFLDIIMMRAKENSKEGGMTPQRYIDTYGPNDTLLTPLDKIKLHAESTWFGKPDFKSIIILFTLSVLIVILSAINFINLKTAQASQRAKEIGVRKAIGSTKSSLVLQFLMETFLICVAAYLLSLALTELLLPSFNKFYDKEIVMNDWRIYYYSFAMVLAVTLISGLIPATYLANFKAIETLKGNFARSKHGIWLRNGILTLQLIISSFFIIGGLIVNNQVKYMMDKDLGYSGKQVLLINFSENNAKPWLKYERIKNEIKKIEGVADVSYGEAAPGSNRYSNSNMDYMDKSIFAQHGSMDYNYLQFMDVKLKKGRWLNPNLASDTIANVLVNEAFVKKFGWTDDQAFKNEVRPGFDNKPYHIVGIVKDFNVFNPRIDVDPIIFFHYRETEWKRYNVYNIQLKLKADDIDGTLKRIKTYWQNNVEPGYPFDSYFIDKKFAESFVKYQKQQTLFTILNAMVLMVALLGLFALSSLMIEQKLKEVAIRKTLGASDGTLIVGLTKQFLWITLIAVLISIPIGYYLMNEWLKDFAYRIDMPIWPYVLSLILLLILTFAVVSIKAYQATKVNLVKYLKYE
ncbi:putative ABC transport system permease protein [Epilithonimonas bovis DSM 19482]|uniref:Putative ABC transport system permease protein n=1 Tax=Epilithonimonas bovis DSM 19482 TaxID=1121284 RepID=A0A1U7PRY4_9FLAO|nr:ABC transporter permease [Epilithonimonas bovis]SIT96326.1 putative ABC transport system permease protein [Epilithonimonas bovis DSM 19482]